jgi:hypothetical protein
VRRALLLAAAALWLAGLAAASQAHTRSRSDSWWRLDETGAEVRLRMTRLDLSRLRPDALPRSPGRDPVADHLAHSLVLRAGDAPCRVVEPPVPRPAREGWASWRWRVDCPPGASPRVIESGLLLEQAPSHLHFARIETAEGEVSEALLAGDSRSLRLDAEGSPRLHASSFRDYVALGIEHIATGWDHLAFVFALLLLAGSWREVAVLVTSFTVAHSVTLALAVLGLVRPDAAAVESLIGFSIALVAAENAWLLGGRGAAVPAVALAAIGLMGVAGLFGAAALSPLSAVGLALFTFCHFALLERAERPARLRAAVAFGFGLVHGFGFAGILNELALPTERLAPALLGFNVGVEIGQVAIVAVGWPLLLLLETRSGGAWHRLVAELASAAIAGLGVFWWVSRSLG